MGNNSQNNWRNKMKEIKLVYGWGINDMPGWPTRGCPFYRTWSRMLQRCYDKNFLNKHPTYRDVTVCEEWKFFSAFKQWMDKQDWEEKDLDKDLRIPGNKGYWPDACLYVKHHINTLRLFDPRKYLDDHPYPQGVQLAKRLTMPDKYVAAIGIDGKTKRLDTFPTVEAASSAYRKAKSEYLRVLADSPDADCPITKASLLRWAVIYELEIVYLLDNGRWVVKHRQTLDSFSG
jgi:hypothetical protein